MALTSIVACDWCGKPIDPPDPWYIMRLFNHAHDVDAYRWDMCDACAVRIRQMMIEHSRVIVSTDDEETWLGGTD